MVMEKEKLVSLVTAAQNGDNDAMNELFNAFYNDFYYFALKTVKDDELALDITQEAFVEIINTLGNLKEPAAFVTWAKQITYHQCTRYFKKKKDVLVDEDEDGNTIFDTLKEDKAEFIPDEALDKADFKKTILAILDELSEEQRSATMMYYFDEMSVKQIAQIQGVSEGTVKSRLNYARKAIKNSVEEYEKKHNIKLHAIPFFPLFKWIFEGAFDGGMPVASAEIVAEGVTTATGTAITVSATTGTTAAVATTTTATAVGIGAKIAAMPLVTKIIAGVVAAAIVICGTTTAILLSDDDNDDLPTGNQSIVSTNDGTSSTGGDTTTSDTSSTTSTDSSTTDTTTSDTTEPHTHTWWHLTVEREALIGRDGIVSRTCTTCNEVERMSTTAHAMFNSFLCIDWRWIIDNEVNDYNIEMLTPDKLLDYVGGTYKGADRDGDFFSISYSKVIEILSVNFNLTDDLKASLKKDSRYNPITDAFNLGYNMHTVVYGILGYVHNNGNSYTVYYTSEDQENGTLRQSYWKAEVEYNLLNDKPNKYLSIVRVESPPSNVITEE